MPCGLIGERTPTPCGGTNLSAGQLQPRCHWAKPRLFHPKWGASCPDRANLCPRTVRRHTDMPVEGAAGCARLDTMLSKMGQSSLTGVWTRRYIRWPDGREDTTTRVWWLQAARHYADLRIPAGRPSFLGIDSLNQCGNIQRDWLARQEGFAGILEQESDAWVWKRWIDFQPPTGGRDIGKLKFLDESGRRMLGEGVDQPYIEHWEKIGDGASSAGEAFVAHLPGEGFFITVGGHFLIVIDRRKSSDSPLNMEISHGMSQGAMENWIVTDSTFPWRQGRPLFAAAPRVDWNGRKLIELRGWEILEPATGRLDWMY